MKRLSVLAVVLLLVLGLAGAAWADSKGLSVTGSGTASQGGVSIWTDKPEYRPGENLMIGFMSSEAGSAAIYHTSADGQSQMLWPRNGQPVTIKAGTTYSIPDGNYNFTVTEPYGTETLNLVVTKPKVTKPATLTLGLALTFLFGGGGDSGSKGLTVDGQTGGTEGGETLTAECSYNIVPDWAPPELRISGGDGALLFVDGNPMGEISGMPFPLEAGYHQVVALLPGMKVLAKDFNMKPDTTYDWSLRFVPAR